VAGPVAATARGNLEIAEPDGSVLPMAVLERKGVAA
jgi:hypothetical protein